MLKMLNMALPRCPVRFSDKMVAVFQIKMSQIYTESDENPKNFPFSNISCIFFQTF